MRYPVKIEIDGSGFIASFPDIPEALTGADTREESMEMALEALVTAFEFYFEEQRRVPIPKKVTGEYVTVPPSIASKVLLLNTFLASGVTQVELAERMGTTKQAIQRVLNIHHSTKIDTIEEALHALGKTLLLKVA